ncbi:MULTISPECIES: LamB/YcsF family protein [Synergistaceae]|jgi:5-oxoprolinase (ATP-hydrolysing) subunit A|uniref:LamB/YcsF family protein n=1 Tax=Synergistaceae TaxID=649777 RepID=UPI003ADC150B|nr:LamB/YcsF family protein [Synergistaceae bacterium DZ-S4]
MYKIDLNSDIGESFGAYCMGDDEAVMDAVTSANVACGFHAGDPLVMKKTIKNCAAKGVAVGAHPGYPDLVGFGRRNMKCTPEEEYADCLYQIGALSAFCRTNGLALQHVKPHGAMYNQAAKDPGLARAIARAVKDSGENIILMGLANSEFENAAKEMGVPFAAEAFADRGYMPDGSLVPRSQPGAIIHDVEEAAKRVVRMVTEGTVGAVDGTVINFRPQSICMHGDTPEAVDMAKTVRRELEAAGVKVTNLKEVVLG